MVSVRQEILAENIVRNAKAKVKKTKGELVELSGYSKASATKKTGEIIASPGVQSELKKLGFSSEGAKKVVAEILYKETAKDGDRLKAADMVFDVQGDKAPEKHLVITKKIVSIDE